MFATMTFNPNWLETQRHVAEGQTRIPAQIMSPCVSDENEARHENINH